MPHYLISALQMLVGIGLLFCGGELFINGSIAIALILGIPQLVIYKLHIITEIIASFFVKVRNANILNIISKLSYIFIISKNNFN